MRHIQQFTLLLFLWITLLAPVGIVASWAGPVEGKALRDAAGCSWRLDVEGVKAALKLGADPNAPFRC